MDSEYTYQSAYIWKNTANDGLLPIANFTEEMNETELRKRGKDKDKGKELGVITDFSGAGDEDDSLEKQKSKAFSNGFYLYLQNKKQYALIKQKRSDT
jgi:hypothetical protein